MKNSESKQPKKEIVRSMNSDVDITPQIQSKKRTDAIKDAVFEAINTTATATAKELGETTINEVLHVLSELVYSYNGRNLETQFEIEIDNKKKK